MERIKDFIYEKSDVFFAGIVIVAVIGVVFYNLSGWLVIDSEASRYHQVRSSVAVSEGGDAAPKQNSEQNTDAPTKNTEALSDTGEKNKTEAENAAEKAPKSNDPAVAPDQKAEAPAQNTAPAQAAPAPSDTQKPAASASTSSGERNITIAAGSSASSIASSLKTQGLISDSQAFLNKIVEMKKETKLKAGSFTIPAGASMEQIINILTK